MCMQYIILLTCFKQSYVLSLSSLKLTSCWYGRNYSCWLQSLPTKCNWERPSAWHTGADRSHCEASGTPHWSQAGWKCSHWGWLSPKMYKSQASVTLLNTPPSHIQFLLSPYSELLGHSCHKTLSLDEKPALTLNPPLFNKPFCKANCLPVPGQIPFVQMQACEMIYYLTGNGGQRWPYKCQYSDLGLSWHQYLQMTRTISLINRDRKF